MLPEDVVINHCWIWNIFGCFYVKMRWNQAWVHEFKERVDDVWVLGRFTCKKFHASSLGQSISLNSVWYNMYAVCCKVKFGCPRYQSRSDVWNDHCNMCCFDELHSSILSRPNFRDPMIATMCCRSLWTNNKWQGDIWSVIPLAIRNATVEGWRSDMQLKMRLTVLCFVGHWVGCYLGYFVKSSCTEHSKIKITWLAESGIEMWCTITCTCRGLYNAIEEGDAGRVEW